MKNIILFLLSLILISGSVNADTNSNKLKEKIDSLWHVGSRFGATNTDSSRAVYMRTILMSDSLDDKFFKGFALANYSVSLTNLALFQNAIDTLKLAYRYGRNSDSIYLRIYTLTQLATTYKDMGMYDSAFVYYDKAEGEYDFSLIGKKDTSRRTFLTASILFTDLGLLYHRMEYHKEALKCFDKALKIGLRVKDKRRVAGTYVNIANVYNQHELYDPEKALLYYKKGQYICEEIGHTRYLGNVYGNLVNLFTKMEQVDSAYYYFDKAKSIVKELQDHNSYVILLESYTNLLELENKQEERLKYLLEGYQLAAKYNILAVKNMFSKKLAQYYSRKKEWEKAFKYKEEYVAVQDSMFDQSLNDRLMQIRISSIQEKQNNEISLITKEKELMASRQEVSTLINITLSLGFIFLLVVVFLFYRANKQKSQYSNELEEKNEELDHLIKDLSKSQKDLELSNQAKDKLFSIIAHDLKNPLSTFITVTDIMSNEFDSMENTEKKEFIEEINKSSKSLFNLLENLLVWSRSQMGVLDFNPMDLDLNYLANQSVEVLALQASKKNVTVATDFAESAVVNGDANMLLTVTRNILSNSIKFTQSGGKITVSTGFIEKYVYIRIEDNGVGIPEDKIKILFEPSATKSSHGTNDEKGTGLGLVLCKDFIDKHSGRIEVQSKVKEGSTFTILIPKAG